MPRRGATARRRFALWLAAAATLAGAAVSDAAAEVDVYTQPGQHTVNGRQWRTTCEPYSRTTRCRTEIWATSVQPTVAGFRQVNGWVFNNLTYLPLPRATWAGNPLAANTAWTAADGRRWRTECDTAVTGRDGCRSYIWGTIPANRGGRLVNITGWVFNNMVRLRPPVRPRGCELEVDGTRVFLADGQRTATVVNSRGSHATLTMVRRTRPGSCDVETVLTDREARVGARGTVAEAERKQDSLQTPAGTFTVTRAFGLLPDPGTALPYRVATAQSYWVVDRNSAWYNTWREATAGGFDRSEGERLADFPGQYDHAAVIDFNTAATPGRGGAIFLHVNGRGATAGCVTTTKENLVTFLRQVQAGDEITIR